MPRGEAWECVNELEPGLALGGRAVPLHPLTVVCAGGLGRGAVCTLVLLVPRLSPLSGPVVGPIWHNLPLAKRFPTVPKKLYKWTV